MSIYNEYSSVQHLQLVKEVALGPESQVLIMNKYCVNGFNFQTKEVSRNKKTNNSGDIDGTGQTIKYYGVIQEIIEVRYLGWPKKKILLFRCEWFDPSHRDTKVDHQHNIIEVKHARKYKIDVELKTTLQHFQHILKEVSDDEILNVEEEISENEKEWENDGIETNE
ncbi:hypothetical protein RDI58_005925 [Solanum bulbocastanum]|uniref:DUF4216 domain-containing protein n=1 Tax=Solanum bulbocastanum TaxID=147425 RepID=A0AAN8YRE0_SOLBU